MKCSSQLLSTATALLLPLLLFVLIAPSPGHAQDVALDLLTIGNRKVQYRGGPLTFWLAYHECRFLNQYLFMPKTEAEIELMKTFLSSRSITDEVYVSGKAIRSPFCAMPSGEPLKDVVNPNNDKDFNVYLKFNVVKGKVDYCDGTDEFTYFCEEQDVTSFTWDDIFDVANNIKNAAVNILFG